MTTALTTARCPASARSSALKRIFAETAFRILFSSIFVAAGTMHLAFPDRVARRLAAAPLSRLVTWVAPPATLVTAAGVVLLIGGLALLFGLGTRLAAAALIAVVVPITVTVQLGSGELGPLFKNVAILGGLVHFAVVGTEGVALERHRYFRRRSGAER